MTAPTVPLVSTPNTGSNVTSVATSFASLPSAGQSIFVVYDGFNSASVAASISCADNQDVGNTYVLDGIKESTGGGRFQVAAIFRCHAIGATSGTFTATVSNLTGSYCNVGAIAATGLVAASPDASATNGAASSTNPATCTSGTTGATTVADALAISVLDYDSDVGPNAGIATPSGYTAIYTGSNANECGLAVYKILSATGAQSAAFGTAINPGGESGVWAAAIDVYKAAAGSTYTLIAGQGSYSLTGSDAQVDLTMVAAQGSYTLTGQTVNFNSNRVVAAGQGSYILSGQSLNLIWSGAPTGGGISPISGIGGAGISNGSGITYVAGISRTTS
jgi:hypothetical protein